MNVPIFCLLCFLLEFSDACSELPGERDSVQERAISAKIIVYAQVVAKHEVPAPPNATEWDIYTGQFQLLCPLKNEEFLYQVESQATNADETFNVTEMGFSSGLCFPNPVLEDERYFMFLREVPGSNPDGDIVSWELDRIDSQTAVFPDTTKHRNEFEAYTTDCSPLNEYPPVAGGFSGGITEENSNPPDVPEHAGPGRFSGKLPESTPLSKLTLGGTTASHETSEIETTPSSGNTLMFNTFLFCFALIISLYS